MLIGELPEQIVAVLVADVGVNSGHNTRLESGENYLFDSN